MSEERFDRIEQRLDRLEAGFVRLDGRLDDLTGHVVRLDSRIDDLGRHMRVLHEDTIARTLGVVLKHASDQQHAIRELKLAVR